MSFRVRIQPANLSIEVQRDEPILLAAIRQGIGLPYGCRDGACGSCKCRLLEGRVIHGAHQAKAMSPDEEQAGFLLTCCATPQTDCVIEARQISAAGEFAVLKMPTRVLEMVRAAPDVIVLRLQLPGNQNFQFHAGQSIDFILQGGQRRSYSRANAPSRLGQPPAIELHLRHLPGGLFTDSVFGNLKVRDILRIEGPFGSFHVSPANAKPIVLLASGTGFAPIKSILEQLQDWADVRPVRLYWGCRVRADLYQHEWAEQAARDMPNLRYVPVLSEPRDADDWRGRVGLVHEVVMADLPDLSGHQVYACGAPVMVHAAERDLVARCGLPVDEFFADAFTSAADRVPA